MNYTQLFRTLREAKALTHDGLAKLANCHRNTVINVESGRPVKFKTIAELMLKMGYDSSSSEMKSVALLWLESISGINLTRDQSTSEARERIEQYRASEREAAQLLVDAAIGAHLTVDQIRTLIFAASRPEIGRLSPPRKPPPSSRPPRPCLFPKTAKAPSSFPIKNAPCAARFFVSTIQIPASGVRTEPSSCRSEAGSVAGGRQL
jgi:DNA-binding XRE family transcriptional regulator